MHDFSSSAYWNAVYASGEDESGQKAVAEWHVDGDVVVQAVERLVGIPPSRREEPAVLNIGCGKSTLSERQGPCDSSAVFCKFGSDSYQLQETFFMATLGVYAAAHWLIPMLS